MSEPETAQASQTGGVADASAGQPNAELRCAHCGRSYTPYRSGQRFCRGRGCRAAAWDLTHPRKRVRKKAPETAQEPAPSKGRPELVAAMVRGILAKR